MNKELRRELLNLNLSIYSMSMASFAAIMVFLSPSFGLFEIFMIAISISHVLMFGKSFEMSLETKKMGKSENKS